MNSIQAKSGGMINYTSRIKESLNRAVETQPEELFKEKFEKIESFVSKFEADPGAIRSIDAKGNSVTTIPDLGSLKRTAKGFEMSILQNSHFSPPLSLAQRLNPWPVVGSGHTTVGLNVTFNEKKQEMKVVEFDGAFILGCTALNCASSQKQSEYTLDLKDQRLNELRESVPPPFSNGKAVFGKDLSQSEPSRLGQFFSDLFAL